MTVVGGFFRDNLKVNESEYSFLINSESSPNPPLVVDNGTATAPNAGKRLIFQDILASFLQNMWGYSCHLCLALRLDGEASN